jgi:hypothetical protein
VFPGEQRIAGDHGGDDALVFVARYRLVVVGERSQIVMLYEPIECDRGLRRTHELIFVAL